MTDKLVSPSISGNDRFGKNEVILHGATVTVIVFDSVDAKRSGSG